MPIAPDDVMYRTMANLEFIEHHAQKSGPYEVTQLINSFLGALAHPWERLSNDLNELSLEMAQRNGWPRIPKERDNDRNPKTIGDLVRFVRNALAHGNIEHLPGQDGEIRALKIWNLDRGRRTWGSVVTTDSIRELLVKFVELAEKLHGKQSRSRQDIA